MAFEDLCGSSLHVRFAVSLCFLFALITCTAESLFMILKEIAIIYMQFFLNESSVLDFFFCLKSSILGFSFVKPMQ